MAFGNRFCACRSQSFYKSEFLFKNYAALSARAFVFDLSERIFSNYAGNYADCAEIYAPCRMGIDCAFNCGFSGKRLYGIESAAFSRIQFDYALFEIAISIGVHCVGVLVYKGIMNKYTSVINIFSYLHFTFSYSLFKIYGLAKKHS